MIDVNKVWFAISPSELIKKAQNSYNIYQRHAKIIIHFSAFCFFSAYKIGIQGFPGPKRY